MYASERVPQARDRPHIHKEPSYGIVPKPNRGQSYIVNLFIVTQHNTTSLQEERTHEQWTISMRVSIVDGLSEHCLTPYTRRYYDPKSCSTTRKRCHTPSILMSFLSLNQGSLTSASQFKKLIHRGARYPLRPFSRIGCIASPYVGLRHTTVMYVCKVYGYIPVGGMYFLNK